MIVKISNRTINRGIFLLTIVYLAHCKEPSGSASNGFNLKSMAFNADVDEYLNPDDATLFNENTPVWIINGTEHYKKFRNGVLKRALDHYMKDPIRAAMVTRPREHGYTNNHIPTLNHMMKTNQVKRAITEMHVKNKDTVYPTILVTTDFNIGGKSHDEKDFYDQMIYQMAYWNAVDLKFRNLTNPKVRLRITGIVIGMDREATPYLHRNMIKEGVNAFNVLIPMGFYWASMDKDTDFPPESYHIVATATNLPLVDEDHPGDRLSGLATHAGLCFKFDGIVAATMVYRDDLNFGTIHTAVHELAHLFGIGHDNGTSGECGMTEGWIMNPLLSVLKDSGKFSKCSLKELSTVLREHDCADKPKEYWPTGKPLGKILPGTMRSPDAQCRARGFEWACTPTPDMCKNLSCWSTAILDAKVARPWKCTLSAPAIEGTNCGGHRICLNGECKSPYP